MAASVLCKVTQRARIPHRGCAAMARAMELLRATWPGLTYSDVTGFVDWVNARLMPNMEYFTDVLSAYPRGFDKTKLMYGNW